MNDKLIVNSLPESTRNFLWSTLKVGIWDHYSKRTAYREDAYELSRSIWICHMKRDLDSLGNRGFANEVPGYGEIKAYFLKSEWFLAMDLLEYIAVQWPKRRGERLEMRSVLNSILNSEKIGYRFVDGILAPTTDQNEVTAIESALKSHDSSIRTHIQQSLVLLSDKQNPDYRNSIKESISAVEAACRKFTGDDKATLGQALKKMGKAHPALSQAFEKLYGYTSDHGGIRHSLIDEPDVDFEEAKFMLVACAAFTTYLDGKRSKATP